MNRYASVDIGSNSSLLLIVERQDDGSTSIVVDTRLSTKLSSEIGSGGLITEAAIERQFVALDLLASILRQQKVREVAVCATQVFRVATNGRQLAGQIGDKYGWNVEIIEGHREAELSYRAAATGLVDIPAERIVVDVGGGSTEVVHGHDRQIIFSASYQIGAVSLSEKCELTRAVDSSAMVDARNQIASAIPSAGIADLPKKAGIIAVGGTASTLAAVFLGQGVFDPSAIHGVRLSGEWLRQTTAELAELSVRERRLRLAFDPDRADIIVGGCLILEYLIEALEKDQVIVSNRGLRWGLLLDKFPFLNLTEIERKG